MTPVLWLAGMLLKKNKNVKKYVFFIVSSRVFFFKKHSHLRSNLLPWAPTSVLINSFKGKKELMNKKNYSRMEAWVCIKMMVNSILLVFLFFPFKEGSLFLKNLQNCFLCFWLQGIFSSQKSNSMKKVTSYKWEYSRTEKYFLHGF